MFHLIDPKQFVTVDTRICMVPRRVIIYGITQNLEIASENNSFYL
jgi:hypothetical protein